MRTKAPAIAGPTPAMRRSSGCFLPAISAIEPHDPTQPKIGIANSRKGHL